MKTRLPAAFLLRVLILPAWFLDRSRLRLRPSLTALSRRRGLLLGTAVYPSGFRDLLWEACQGKPACTILATWDFTGRFSWVPTHSPGWGREALLDQNYSLKRTYKALREVLEAQNAGR